MEVAYNPEPVAALLRELVAERGQSLRRASLAAGLDRGALFRFIEQGRRPARESLLILADYFGVNPNVLLELAGYAPLAIFSDVEHLPPEVKGVVQRLTAIAEPVARSRVISAVEVLLEAWAEAGATG